MGGAFVARVFATSRDIWRKFAPSFGALDAFVAPHGPTDAPRILILTANRRP